MGGGRSGNQVLAAQTVPASGVRPKKRVERPAREIVMGDDVLEQEQGSHGVVERIVPTAAGVVGFEDRAETATFAERRERVIRQFRPCGAGEQQGIDPRTEAVAGKCPEEALFGALAVGDDDSPGEVLFHLRPQGEQGRSAVQVLVPDAVDLARGPRDWSLAGEVGHEALAVAIGGRPSGDADLHRHIRPATGSTRRLEVDGSEAAVPDGHGRKGSTDAGGLAMGKASDGGLPRGARWRKFRRS